MTKETALRVFREEGEDFIRDCRKRKDVVMLREAWNNYTDGLCKEGRITLRQYETWTNPF